MPGCLQFISISYESEATLFYLPKFHKMSPLTTGLNVTVPHVGLGVNFTFLGHVVICSVKTLFKLERLQHRRRIYTEDKTYGSLLLFGENSLPR